MVGLEPTTAGATDRSSTTELHPPSVVERDGVFHADTLIIAKACPALDGTSTTADQIDIGWRKKPGEGGVSPGLECCTTTTLRILNSAHAHVVESHAA